MFFKGFTLFQHFSSIRFLHAFCIDFGITFWSIFASKPCQNLIKKTNNKLHDFCIDFSTIFDGFGTPFSSQVGPSWHEVGHQGPSWSSSWRSWAPLWLQDAAQAPPRGSQTPPDLHFHRFSDHFWKDLGQIFEHFLKLEGLLSSVSIKRMLCELSLTVGFKTDPNIDSIPISSKLLEHCFKNRGRHGGGFARAAHW